MNINLHIERLILEGIPVSHGGGPHVQAAIEAELTRLIAASGVSGGFHAGDSVPSIRAGDIQVAAADSHADLGRHIAGALHEGITR